MDYLPWTVEPLSAEVQPMNMRSYVSVLKEKEVILQRLEPIAAFVFYITAPNTFVVI